MTKNTKVCLNHFKFGRSVGSHPLPTLSLTGYDRERVTRKRKTPIDRIPVKPIRTKKEKSDTEKKKQYCGHSEEIVMVFHCTISRIKGDHYYIQTRYNDFFFSLQSILFWENFKKNCLEKRA